MQLIAALGAILAGLFMFATQLPPLLKARRTGVIISKSHGAPRIERAADPVRFDKLFKQRRAQMAPGAVLILVGVLLAASFVYGVSQMQAESAARYEVLKQAAPAKP